MFIYFGDGRLPPRFWVKVRILENGCWEWRAGRGKDSYGQFHWQGQHRPAHRVAYELLVGPFPSGLESDHLCRNRACVKPAHIEPVTHRENILRGNAISARNAVKTHCLNGHAFNGENTYVYPDGKRACRVCYKAHMHAYYVINRERLSSIYRAYSREYRKRKREAALA